MKRVAVLMGGWSAERDISLISGNGVADALERRGYTVARIDVQRDLPSLIAALTPPPTVIFNALHGRGGEDGTVQGVLEFLNIPYTHSGVLASALAMDKELTRTLVARAGVRVPRGVVVTKDHFDNDFPIPLPIVIKPVNEGSSVGVHIVTLNTSKKFSDYKPSTDSTLLVEEFIPGRELTVAVFDDQPLAVTEIQPSSDFFDYTAKYTKGRAIHHTPAKIPTAVERKAMEWALLAHRTLGCTGVSRTDFRWNDTLPETNGLYFLEINSQPGMTPLSLVPEQALHKGISYEDLVVQIVELAQCHV